MDAGLKQGIKIFTAGELDEVIRQVLGIERDDRVTALIFKTMKRMKT